MQKRMLRYTLYATIIIGLTSCARPLSAPKEDPLENMNRAIFGFNRVIDKIAIKPAAQVYNFIVPPPLQRGVRNVFSNVGEVRNFANDMLQGKVGHALSDLGRLIINSTIGIGGLFDPASHMGLAKHYEDFGMTIAAWNNNTPSPYLVLPLLGPTTMRAAVGKAADYFTSPWPYLDNKNISYIAYGTFALNVRSGILPADKLIDTSFDPYIFVRNAYLQKRRKMIKENASSDTKRDIKNETGYLTNQDYINEEKIHHDKVYVDDDIANLPVKQKKRRRSQKNN